MSNVRDTAIMKFAIANEKEGKEMKDRLIRKRFFDTYYMLNEVSAYNVECQSSTGNNVFCKPGCGSGGGA